MDEIKYGEVWFAKFPYEEDETKIKARPVVVLDVETLKVLSVKVTKTYPREEDDYDLPILYWQEAKLRFKSTARVSKAIHLDKTAFDFKIGDLHQDDLHDIQESFIKFINSKE